MRRLEITTAVLLLSLLAACAEDSSPGEGSAAAAIPPATDFTAFAERQVFEPQLVAEDDGTLLMVWRQKGEAGADLFAAHLTPDGIFSEPARINDEPGTVYGYPHDEMRPAVATAPDGQLAVSWADERSQIRAAFGSQHGEVWEPSVRLDQEGTPAYRSFTASGLDAEGALHTVWIDSRHAPQAGAEEPADLFYARVTPRAAEWGAVTEVNLTADQGASICGCCKPDLEIASDGSIRAIFRNTTDDGFRDIFTISGNYQSGFGAAERIGPPTWKLQGCPMSGPLGLAAAGLDGTVMWRDASSGEWKLKQGRPGSDEVAEVFPDGVGEWKMSLSPRAVAAAPGVLLIPGQPTSRLIERQNDSWAIVRDDLPVWATSAAAVDGGVLVIGAVDGQLEAEILQDE